jgi:HK97 family phage prohead protease
MIRTTFNNLVVVEGATAELRRVSGIAVPIGVTGIVQDGKRVRFAPGSLPLTGAAPKLLEGHDAGRLVGVVTARAESADAVTFEARISKTRAGDDALQLALDGALDSVSVGVNPTRYHHEGDVLVIEAADWLELSLVPFPAFSEARIVQVAAEAEAEAEAEAVQPTPKETTLMDVIAEPEAVVNAATAPVIATLAHRRRTVTAAEYLSAYLSGSTDFAAIRAATDDTGDIPGLLPTPIVGAVYDDLLGLRPFVDAIRVRAMPAGGKVFIRPKVTTHVSVAQQVNEHDPLSSTALVIDDIQLTKKTFGGFLTLSEQEVDWSDVSIVQIVLDELMDRYAEATEADACGSVVAGSTIAGITWTSATDVVDAIYDAAAAMSSASGYLPDAIAVGTTRWADLGKLSDASDRPLFPVLAPSNALGQASAGSWAANVLGLKVIVSQGFGATDVFVMHTRGVEAFEQPKGAIQASDPSTMAQTLAWRGYFCAHTIDDTKVVELTA